jgi:hypothetical protein
MDLDKGRFKSYQKGARPGQERCIVLSHGLADTSHRQQNSMALDQIDI